MAPKPDSVLTLAHWLVQSQPALATYLSGLLAIHGADFGQLDAGGGHDAQEGQDVDVLHPNDMHRGYTAGYQTLGKAWPHTPHP